MCCILLCLVFYAQEVNAEVKWREQLRRRRSSKVFMPLHPRVDINWTDGFIKSNLTHDELAKIE